MRSRFIFLSMLLVGVLLGLPPRSTWAAEAAESVIAADSGAAPAPSAAIPQRGALFRVRFHGHTSYLFGTIHVGKPDFFPLEPQAAQAFDQSAAFMLEVDMRDTASLQNALTKYGLYAGNDTLDRHLSPATLARLKQVLAQIGMPYEAMAHVKAWLAADILLVKLLERQGYHVEEGADQVLLKQAQAQGKLIQGMETADFQLSLFDGMSEQQQEQYLNDNLDDITSGEAVRKTQELLDAWGRADAKAFDALLREAQDDTTVAGQFLLHKLVEKRNPTMADCIATLLKQQATSFVGVGVLHLVGADGVPQLLARRGYQVTRLY